MRDRGLHFCVMLCGRGLRTTHIHRPITTFLTAKLQIILICAAAYCRIFLLSVLRHVILLAPGTPVAICNWRLYK